MKPLERTEAEKQAQRDYWERDENNRRLPENAKMRMQWIVAAQAGCNLDQMASICRDPGTNYRPLRAVTHPFQLAPDALPPYDIPSLPSIWMLLGAGCIGAGFCFCGFWGAFHYPTITACSVVVLGTIAGLYWLSRRSWRSQ